MWGTVKKMTMSSFLFNLIWKFIYLQRKKRRKSREKSKYSLLGSEGFGFQMVRIHPCPNNLHVWAWRNRGFCGWGWRNVSIKKRIISEPINGWKNAARKEPWKRHGDLGVQEWGVEAVGGRGCDGVGAAAHGVCVSFACGENGMSHRKHRNHRKFCLRQK